MSPKAAQAEANAVFKKSPISASLSGLWPRLIGVLLRRVAPGDAERVMRLGAEKGNFFDTEE